MRVVLILKRTSYAFLLALLMLFALPLAMYGPAAAQSADEASEAQLLLYPDPAILAPGGTIVVDVRLHTDAPVYEAHVTLTTENPRVRFTDLFLGTSTPFRVFDRFISSSEASFVLQAPEGFSGQRVIGRILLEAADAAQPGDTATIGYGGSTTVLGPDLGHITLVTRPSAVRVEEQSGIVITSTTHLDERSWYRKRNANVTWQTDDGAQYSYDISPLASDIPNDEPNEPIGAIEMRELEDGVWYFALCELEAGECGDISRRRYMIDATPPDDFAVRIERQPEDGGMYAYFAPHDGQSDILRIEAAVDPEGALSGAEGDRSVWIEVESPYRLPDSYAGDLLIRATDFAGNATTARVTIPSGREGRTTAALMLIFSSAFAAYALWRAERRVEKQS